MARPRAAAAAPIYFEDAAGFRRWLERHHAAATELVVGFHERGTGAAGMTWREAVDEALCFGWIDGVAHRVDAARYTIRFTPRRPGSTWSAVNVARVEALVRGGRMRPAGAAAFARRSEERSATYAHERRRAPALASAESRRFRADAAAWAAFQARSPWYRRSALHWVITAKREETRARRLELLVACSRRGEAIPLLRPRDGSRGRARR